MTKEKKRKILIIVGIIVSLLLVVSFLLLRQSKKRYLEEPIEQNSISTTSKKKVLLKSTSILNRKKNYSLWEVENKYKLTKIEEIANNWGFENTSAISGIAHEWERGEEYIFYDLVENTVFIKSKELERYTPEEGVTNKTFTNIVNELFDEKWSYVISGKKAFDEDVYAYYANRILYEDLPVNINGVQNHTDHISLKDGKIGLVKIFLGSFKRIDEELPILSSRELGEKLNDKDYPKVIYPSLSDLPEELLNSFSYLHTKNHVKNKEAFEASINNCVQDSNLEVVYLYKYAEQGLLLPTYKLDTKCTATYKGKKYIVPALVFLNAIDPKYIETETEK